MFNKLNVIFLGWRFFLALISLSSILNAKPDLAWVNLNVRPDFKKKIIFVKCLQKWKVDKSDTTLHFLFSSNLKVDTVFLNEKVVPWNHRDDSLFIKIKPTDKEQTITFIYHGSPVVANNPPWDGGVIWKKSAGGRHWLTVAIQDKGAMVWWPAPARFDDRPDSAVVSCIYPGELFFKGNGRLIFDRKLSSGMRRTTWRVSYPINTYNITLNIGDYRHFSDTLVRKDGSKLSLDYYPLRKNLSAAKRQFQQVRPMLDCYEDFFGRYPFQNDGFSVVEVPYAGMEHQGAIAYGNKYQDGYLGEDYSGIRIDFDFILIHETGHEWWGNSVTGINPIDSWHQEAFCTYAEYVYVKCRFGNRIAREYINEKKRFVENEYPILDGNNTGTDRYNKGALMLFTLEQLIGPETMSELLFRLAEEKKIFLLFYRTDNSMV